MEFGKVENPDLSGIDFTLAPDPSQTAEVLSRSSRKPLEVFIGCAKWGRKDWIGKIYPHRTKEADFLRLYGKHFNSIELNASFYRLPRKNQTAAWAAAVGDNFKFVPKVTDKISHIKRLKEAKDLTDIFVEGISGFGNKLGPVFLMPHPGMGSKTLDTMEAFIESLPKGIELFVELRNRQWFEPDNFEKVFSMFQRHNVGSIITDAAGRRDCVHMRLTKPSAFVRFVGNDLDPTDYTRADEWVQRIKSWKDQGLETLYFFMHQNEEVNSPQMCQYVIQELNRHCGTNIPEPVFVDPNEAPPPPKTRKRS